MSNMSYCRFENTLSDVRECIDALNNREISSDSEKGCAKSLLADVLNFCISEGIIEEYDEDGISEIINDCSSSGEE